MPYTLGVVIPHYNDSRFLADAITACLEGARPADRILVIDDGSSESEYANANAIVAALRTGTRSKIDLQRQVPNRGVVPTLNRGLQDIGTDLVLFRAADDRTLPGFFAETVPLLEAFPATGLGVADIRYYTEAPTEGVVEPLGLPRAGYFSPAELSGFLSGTSILHSGAVVFDRR